MNKIRLHKISRICCLLFSLLPPPPSVGLGPGGTPAEGPWEGAPAPPWATAAAVGPREGGGDRLEWGHPKRLYKAPTDYTKPQKILEEAPTDYTKPQKHYKMT